MEAQIKIKREIKEFLRCNRLRLVVVFSILLLVLHATGKRKVNNQIKQDWRGERRRIIQIQLFYHELNKNDHQLLYALVPKLKIIVIRSIKDKVMVWRHTKSLHPKYTHGTVFLPQQVHVNPFFNCKNVSIPP